MKTTELKINNTTIKIVYEGKVSIMIDAEQAQEMPEETIRQKRMPYENKTITPKPYTKTTPRNRLTLKDKKEEVRRMYQDEGKKASEIAKILGYKTSSIKVFLSEQKIKATRPRLMGEKLQKRIAEIKRLYIDLGIPRREVARRIGISPKAFDGICYRNNIKRPALERGEYNEEN